MIMATVIYEIPSSIKEMFEQGESSYRIIDYSISEMDNIQSMQYFLECIGATSENIETDDGTQVVVKHSDFAHKLVIDSGGLGDFYSHGYDVTLLESVQKESVKIIDNKEVIICTRCGAKTYSYSSQLCYGCWMLQNKQK